MKTRGYVGILGVLMLMACEPSVPAHDAGLDSGRDEPDADTHPEPSPGRDTDIDPNEPIEPNDPDIPDAGGSPNRTGRPGWGAAPGTPTEPGEPVDIQHDHDVASLQSQLEALEALDADALAKKHAVAFEESLGYDPMQAEGLELLQSSNLALQPAARDKLEEHGFTIVEGETFPTFFYAYLTVYGEDLPVYVSADSVLDALHRSYDDILADIEIVALVPQLRSMLSEVRGKLAQADSLSPRVKADLERYLAVAQALLEGEVPEPLSAGVTRAEVEELFQAAMHAEGIKSKELFGVQRKFDFSQFKPRGHYEGEEELEAYFRAMMWLGRVDFRMIETESGGGQVFRRRQLEAVVALRQLIGEETRRAWESIDATVSAFVGEHDYMILPQVDDLMADLDAQHFSDLAALSDQAIAQAIVDGGYGAQRIASHVIYKGLSSVGTLPLNVSFALFGQRYTVDSHVFSNVVYDRAGGGTVRRYMPDPLDAAFAALGNDHAVALLEDELSRYDYASDLASMRTLVDAHPEAYWDGSLYTRWLESLRALSPSAPGAGPTAEGLPSVARSEAWGRRMLNTQLGSWSQLRHDTLLYAKQSYTVGTVCEFPDAYVDPYPGFFAKIGELAAHGKELASTLDFGERPEASHFQARIGDYFDTLGEVAATLQEMAEHQRTGMPHSEAHLAFINDVVDSESGGSGPPSVEGWYAQLFYDPQRALEHDPIIADVHTDVGGTDRPSQILHVATGWPRLMVVTVDTCSGPRAYVGPAFGYHEKNVIGVLDRTTDSEWAAEIESTGVPEVPWMESILAP